MTVLTVPGRDGATYPVRIGALHLGPMSSSTGSIALVSDDHVWRLHGNVIEQALTCDVHLVPRGEAAKNWHELERLIAFLAARSQQRGDPVIAFGGGAIGDLTGLAASLFKRGCPVIQVPTTLLAMVDSSVGGKTAIDANGQKNLVGAFHPPVAVHADPAFLATLDPRELHAGVAETIKYGLIGDADMYDWLVADGGGKALIAHDVEAARRAIALAVGTKANLVDGDLEDRSGRRSLLNLGHSFGHAIESVAGLGTVLHGEAVAIGMVMAARLSERLGYLGKGNADRIASDFAALDLPTDPSAFDVDPRSLFAPMLADKKNEDGAINLILMRAIGDAFIARDVDPDALRAFLEGR
ncbi:3-dehydroquinate synthase [Sphingomicrobium sp. XHP0239]|uniref:3-dehydroquinate synthase n=1 Tax=Sphingomicrobium maritimum TaxID=3133972 RepID=UPI0031CC5F43